MKNLLIVVDMQKDFVDGNLGTKEAVAIVDAVVEKVKHFDGEVIFTRDTHFDNYMETMEGHYLPVPHCIVNTKGWQIIPEVMTTRGNIEVIDKYDFGDLGIADALQTLASRCWESWDIDEIEIVGLCTDICVISNALILKTAFRGIPITVDSKCCAGVSPAKHEAALEVMRSCQIEVV